MKIGDKIYWVKSCPSTNDIARELASQGESEGAVVIAEEQTEGRGTKGRPWFSARKMGFYLSVVLRPQRADLSLLPLAAGIAVSDAVHSLTGFRICLRWPNDLIFGNKKMGGILCESSFLGNRLGYVILGIGLNIKHSIEDFPDDFRGKATSLRMILERDVDEMALLKELWESLDCWYNLFLGGEESRITRTFEMYSFVPVGSEVTAETERGVFSGIFRGVDPKGSLILEVEKKRMSFSAAEVRKITELREEG